MPKPWKDKSPAPYQGNGDTDGDDNGAYKIGPGEMEHRAPSENPGGDTASREPGGTD